LAGLLHDLGKYTAAFQRRLTGAAERVDHSVLFPIGAWLAGVVDRAALVRLGRELRRGPR
jgi:hypothetical protein